MILQKLFGAGCGGCSGSCYIEYTQVPTPLYYAMSWFVDLSALAILGFLIYYSFIQIRKYRK